MTDTNQEQVSDDLGDEVDPLDALLALNDEINDPETGHRARVRKIAQELNRQVQEAAEALANAQNDADRGAALMLVVERLVEACTATLDEQAETTMVVLGDLSQAVTEVAEDLRADDDEAESGSEEGEGIYVGILPDDSLMLRTLLSEYRGLMMEIGSRDPQRAGVVNAKIAQIDAAIERVGSMELPPEMMESEDAGGDDQG